MILSRTKIFNAFPSTIQLGNMLKILISNCDKETIGYIPVRDLWINRLYMSLSSESKHACLTIDCIKTDPAKYRTSAESNFEQFCYFVQNKKDGLFNKFLAKKDLQSKNPLVFKIDSVISVAENGETKIFKAVQELANLAKQNDGNNGGNCGTKIADEPKRFDREYFGGRKKMEEDLDFFFSNNASQPKKKRKYETTKIKPYNTTSIKSRKFLTNISYMGIKEEDLFDRSFVFDVYTLTTKSIYPFLLERKIFDVKDREMISLLWEECSEPSFYKHICQPKNFLYLNAKNVINAKVAQIVMDYIEKDENNFDKLKSKLIESKKIFQFVYSSTYPEVYSFVEK